MKLVFLNHMSKTKKTVEITDNSFDKLENEYGMRGFFSQYANKIEGLKDFADYLSNHHLDVVLVGDKKENE